MRASDRRIARVEVFDDLTVAEPHWRALELVDSLATPYQRYDFRSQPGSVHPQLLSTRH
jgi:hypothetical protein